MCEIAGSVTCGVETADGHAVIPQACRIRILNFHEKSNQATPKNSLFGGLGKRTILSGTWHATHATHTELSAETEFPALVFSVPKLARAFGDIERAPNNDDEKSKIPAGSARGSSLVRFLVGTFFIGAARQFFSHCFVAYIIAQDKMADGMNDKGFVWPHQRAWTRRRKHAPSRQG
jgi:hypothetical protein